MGGKYLKYIPESWGEPEGILIENTDKEKFKIHFYRLNMNLPPFVEESAAETIDNEWNRIEEARDEVDRRNAANARMRFGAYVDPERQAKAEKERWEAEELLYKFDLERAKERAAAAAAAAPAAAAAAAAAAPQANLGDADELRKKKKRGGRKKTKKRRRKSRRKKRTKKRKRRKKKRKTRR